MTVDEITVATKGMREGGRPDLIVSSVSKDTRILSRGDLYVAIRGEKFDGHQFIKEAAQKGASGAMIQADWKGSQTRDPFFFIRVADTLEALGQWAGHWRQKFTIPVIAVTGSSGKTTTKDMLASILGMRGLVCATQGNLNNLIGMPFSIFTMNLNHQFAVFEMGMNRLREIAKLAQIAGPTIGIITNVGRAHLEGVGGIEGAAKAKGELFEALTPSDLAVVNQDDPWIARMTTKARRKTFSLKNTANVFCTAIKACGDETEVTLTTASGAKEFKLPFRGQHLVADWLAAYCVCEELGITDVEIAEGSKKMTHAKMRGEESAFNDGIILVDDTYNANPDSVAAALDSLSEKFPGRRKIAVLGDMLELGGFAEKLHGEVGARAAQSGVDVLLAYGTFSRAMVEGFERGSGDEAFAFEEVALLNEKLKGLLKKDDVVLVKGSRDSRMERVVVFIRQYLG